MIQWKGNQGFQGVIVLPANFLALKDTQGPQADWVPTPSLTNYFILLQIANCAKGQRHSHTSQWLPGCFFFFELHTKDWLRLSHHGQLAVWPEGLWLGAQNDSDTVYFSVSFVQQIRCPGKL